MTMPTRVAREAPTAHRPGLKSARRTVKPGWVWPAATGAAALLAVAWVAAVDPEEAGHFPTCPFLTWTGFWCPGCGGLRAVHSLTHGDLATAIDLNLLAVGVIPVVVLAWLQWLSRSVNGRSFGPRRGTTVLLWALLALVLTFWLLRNLSIGSWLAP